MRPTNAEVMRNDALLAMACLFANTPVTKRQASKWQNGKGKAIRFMNDARKAFSCKHEMNEETKRCNICDMPQKGLGI